MQAVKFASVRFMEERTAIIRLDGSVQNVLEIMADKKFPGTDEKYLQGADFRMCWLTTAMNVMGKRRFEFADMQDNDLVMKQVVAR